jgi:5'-3' exonuclease
MSRSPWLIFDCHYLCHRAFHTTQELSYEGMATGVIYGFLRAVTKLKEDLGARDCVFCFEHKTLHRREIFPDYKKKRRREMDEQELEAYRSLAHQIKLLRKEYLPRIGYKNILCQRGMESDDLMAAVASRIKSECYIITGDSDMYQCLSPTCSIYDPRTLHLKNEQWFKSKYGISPNRWALVKAMSGCHSDGVPGIKGIGEKTALRYITGTLPEKSKAYALIKANQKTIQSNMRLVRLPYTGCRYPFIKKDTLDYTGWADVCKELGIRTIVSRERI